MWFARSCDRTARVIRSPSGARLEPGEILVGAVVAREYAIPAVVGVAGATEQIKTGRRITVDGSAGTVVLEAESSSEVQPLPTG
jgi:rifampicin phosphotransferase